MMNQYQSLANLGQMQMPSGPINPQNGPMPPQAMGDASQQPPPGMAPPVMQGAPPSGPMGNTQMNPPGQMVGDPQQQPNQAVPGWMQNWLNDPRGRAMLERSRF